jgi:hypothetical protein
MVEAVVAPPDSMDHLQLLLAQEQMVKDLAAAYLNQTNIGLAAVVVVRHRLEKLQHPTLHPQERVEVDI